MPSPQFTAPYRAWRFPPEVIDKAGSVTFTADDLAHALHATGRAPGDQWAHGSASVWEWVHRTSLIPAYIRQTPGGRLTRSQLALDLDRSEKVGVSYAMGQALTNIFCEKMLSTRFLMHVDRYATRFGVTFNATRKRADLFGPDLRGGWIIAEAKGRSNSMESELEQTLIAQKRSIALVAGTAPILALGCVASFPPKTQMLEIDAFDPDKDEIEAVHLDVNLDRYFLAYYEPFVAAIDFGGEEEIAGEDSEMIFVRLPLAGLRLGILRSIADRVRAASRGDVTGLADAITLLLEQATPFAGFPDGTAVETDWENSLTINDWEASSSEAH
jgi:hypothetical protein